MNKRSLIIILLVIAISVIILPTAWYSMHSIPYADDFSDARRSEEYVDQYGNYLKSAVVRTKDIWMDYQGTYTGIFFISGLNAYARWDLLGLRLFNTICILLFFATLLYLSYIVCKCSSDSVIVTLSVYSVILFWITNNYINSEIFTWFNVVCVYVIPMVFLLVGAAQYIEFGRGLGIGWIIASICAVFVGGAPVNGATLGCGIYLIICSYVYCQNGKKNRIQVFFPLVTIVIATIFNVIAPGNYVRWGDEGRVSLIRVTAVSMIAVVKRLWRASTLTPFIALAVVLFFVVYKYVDFEKIDSVSFKHPFLVASMYFMGCTIVNVPYCLGNRMESINISFEDRAYFIQDLSLYFLTVIWVFYFAGYIRKRYANFEIKNSHIALIMLLCISSVLMVATNEEEHQLTTPYMLVSIADGSAKDYADYQEEIINVIKYGDNVDVVYYDSSRHDKKNPIIKGLRLSDDPDRWDMWHNNAIADYFGKSVPLIVYND